MRTLKWHLKINGQSVGKYLTLERLYDAITAHITVGEDKITIEGKFVSGKRN